MFGANKPGLNPSGNLILVTVPKRHSYLHLYLIYVIRVFLTKWCKIDDICICMSVICLRGGCMFRVAFPVWVFFWFICYHPIMKCEIEREEFMQETQHTQQTTCILYIYFTNTMQIFTWSKIFSNDTCIRHICIKQTYG